uniref:Uncharacterized protein n=1 Tax=Arthrobotrys musiformis TaxID=47236 RepID=A0A482EAK0_9PEZI|nr:hypothetical protein [Arthrobotrys musiformis]
MLLLFDPLSLLVLSFIYVLPMFIFAVSFNMFTLIFLLKYKNKLISKFKKAKEEWYETEYNLEDLIREKYMPNINAAKDYAMHPHFEFNHNAPDNLCNYFLKIFAKYIQDMDDYKNNDNYIPGSDDPGDILNQIFFEYPDVYESLNTKLTDPSSSRDIVKFINDLEWIINILDLNWDELVSIILS